MSGATNARGTVHVEAHVADSAAKRLAGMQPHPHPQRCAIRPGALRESLLRRDSRPYCISGPRECHKEGVPLSIDLLAVPFCERIPEKAAVFLQDLSVPAVAEALEERGGPLDVGEEEGDRPGRQGSQMRPPWEAE